MASARVVLAASAAVVSGSGVRPTTTHSDQVPVQAQAPALPQTELRRRLTPIGRMALLTETPTNRSIPTFAITVCGKPDLDMLAAALDDKLCKVERFRSKIERSPSGDNAWFVPLPLGAVRSKHHIFPSPVPLVTYADLRAFLGSHVNAELSVGQDQPPWEFWVDQSGPDTVLVGRVHHSLADGVALGGVMTALTDDAEVTFDKMMTTALKQGGAGKANKRRTWFQRIMRLLQACLGVPVAVAMQLVFKLPLVLLKYLRLLARRGPRALQGQVGTAKTTAFSQPARRSADDGQPRGKRTPDLTFRIDDVKRAGKRLGKGATVNDVVTCAVMQTLRAKAAEAQGKDPKDVTITAMVPVNLRGLFAFLSNNVPSPTAPLAERLNMLQGNHIGTLTLDFDLGKGDDSVQALARVRNTMRWYKRSPEALVSYVTAVLFGQLPLSTQRSLAAHTLRNVDVAISNVVGPDETLTMQSHEIKQIVGFVPPPPGVPLGIVISSYAGVLQLSIAADESVVGNAEDILDGIERRLRALIDQTKAEDKEVHVGITRRLLAIGERAAAIRAKQAK